MGTDMVLVLERKSTCTDAQTCQARLAVMLCAGREECVLPKAVMEAIARGLVGEIFPAAAGGDEGGERWARCDFLEHISATPRRWCEMYADMTRQKAECIDKLKTQRIECVYGPFVVVSEQEWRCEECEDSMPVGTSMRMCQDCSIDICESCATKRAERDQHYPCKERAHYDFCDDDDNLASTVEQEVSERMGLTQQTFTSRFSDRGGIYQLVNADTWFWRDATACPAQLTCMIPGLPADISDQRAETEYQTGRYPDCHDYCHCYLDGLFAVNWEESVRSPINSGFSPSVEAIQSESIYSTRSS